MREWRGYIGSEDVINNKHLMMFWFYAINLRSLEPNRWYYRGTPIYTCTTFFDDCNFLFIVRFILKKGFVWILWLSSWFIGFNFCLLETELSQPLQFSESSCIKTQRERKQGLIFLGLRIFNFAVRDFRFQNMEVAKDCHCEPCQIQSYMRLVRQQNLTCLSAFQNWSGLFEQTADAILFQSTHFSW